MTNYQRIIDSTPYGLETALLKILSQRVGLNK